MKRLKIVLSFIMVVAAIFSVFGVYACGTPSSETGKEPDDGTETFVPSELTEEEVNSFDKEFVNLYGRTYVKDGALILDHAATAIEFGIYGTNAKASISSPKEMYICVFADDVFLRRIALKNGKNRYSLFSNLEDAYHKIKIVKSSEAIDGEITLSGLYADKFATVPEKPQFKIEFIGDSITAGYGITGSSGSVKTLENSDATLTYAYVAATKLNADYSIVAVSGICVKKVFSQRSMDDVYRKVSEHNDENYAFNFDPDVVVINLGGNDAAYMRQKDASYEEQFPTDYYDFLQFVREKNPRAYIICIHGMMGADAKILAGIKKAVSDMHDARIVIFDDYVMNTSATQGHPCSAANEIWGETLAEYVKELVTKD